MPDSDEQSGIYGDSTPPKNVCNLCAKIRTAYNDVMTNKNGCISLFLLPFIAVGIGLTVWGGIIIRNASVSKGWPTAQGEITVSRIHSSTDEDGTTYYADIEFKYVLNDRWITADTVNFGEYGSSNPDHANDIIADYPVGKTVTVYYDPEQVETAVLEPGLTWSSYAVLAMGIIFLIIPVIMILSLFLSRIQFSHLFLLGLLLVGCTNDARPMRITAVLPTRPSPTPNPPTPIPAPPSPIPDPSTPIPAPAPLTLSVPPQWQNEAAQAIAALNAADPAHQWHLTEENAAVTLEQGEDGVLVFADPIALAVPFSDRREAVTLAEATAGGDFTPLLWRDMPPTHKPLRVDGLLPSDTGYPLQERWVLTGTEAEAMAALQPILTEAMRDEVVRLTAVGDIMLSRYLGEKIADRGQINYPFAKMLDSFAGAELLMGNFESSLGDIGKPAAKTYRFQSPPEAAQTLANAGFDLVTLANNHALDYGGDALLQGIGLLHDQGVATIGAGADSTIARTAYITETNGLTIATVGYVHVPKEYSTGFDVADWTATDDTPGLAWGDPETIRADVTALAAEGYDLIVVQLHSGYEYIEEPSEEQMAAAHAAVDAGAALVIGHHAHILQGIEYYNGGVIVYGLGNFAFHIEGEPQTAVINIWLDSDGVRQLELIPAIIQEGGAPRPADPDEAKVIRERVYWLTDILNYPSNWKEIEVEKE